MTKKGSNSRGFSGCFVLLVIVGIVAIAGIFAGFYLLQEGNLFISSDDTPLIGVNEMNPDATQIPETSSPVTPDTDPGSLTFVDILIAVNEAREAEGLDPVSLNSLLNQAAAQQAVYNASIYDATHEDANGDLADVRVTAQGYSWSHVGENLLANWSLDGQRVFTLWQGSPSHNANMMNPDFTEIGLAYMVTPIGQTYHAMVLAHPQ